VKITHRNVIANVLQYDTMHSIYERKGSEYALGVLPQSHALALIGNAHFNIFRGNGVIILQAFDIHDVAKAIQQYKIGILWMVRHIYIFFS
jgi:acyl-CoA synthetase (AMP-forming)/AMP-acid ligase II